eukprot:scaffold96289_cov19-Tisochrysis_lutea.AAC.1
MRSQRGDLHPGCLAAWLASHCQLLHVAAFISSERPLACLYLTSLFHRSNTRLASCSSQTTMPPLAAPSMKRDALRASYGGIDLLKTTKRKVSTSPKGRVQ